MFKSSIPSINFGNMGVDPRIEISEANRINCDDRFEQPEMFRRVPKVNQQIVVDYQTALSRLDQPFIKTRGIKNVMHGQAEKIITFRPSVTNSTFVLETPLIPLGKQFDPKPVDRAMHVEWLKDWSTMLENDRKTMQFGGYTATTRVDMPDVSNSSFYPGQMNPARVVENISLGLNQPNPDIAITRDLRESIVVPSAPKVYSTQQVQSPTSILPTRKPLDVEYRGYTRVGSLPISRQVANLDKCM